MMLFQRSNDYFLNFQFLIGLFKKNYFNAILLKHRLLFLQENLSVTLILYDSSHDLNKSRISKYYDKFKNFSHESAQRSICLKVLSSSWTDRRYMGKRMGRRLTHRNKSFVFSIHCQMFLV